MQNDISVESPEHDDKTAWENLYYGYADFYQVPMDQTILDTVWQWIHDPQYPFYALVARHPVNDLVGLMHFREMPSPLRGKHVGFLDDLFVTPDHRGEGVVDALFTELQQQCKSKEWPLIRWITADNNYRGRAVYDKLADKTHWVTYQMNDEY